MGSQIISKFKEGAHRFLHRVGANKSAVYLEIAHEGEVRKRAFYLSLYMLLLIALATLTWRHRLLPLTGVAALFFALVAVSFSILQFFYACTTFAQFVRSVRRSRAFYVILCLALEIGIIEFVSRVGGFSTPDLAALFLGMIALTFAFFQFYDARQHTKKMEEIADSMSTRYIGAFPRNMDQIIKVVSDAEKRISIQVDYVDYGRYSKPEGFDKYAEALIKALKNDVWVRVLIYTGKLAEDTMKSQFESAKFNRMKRTREYKRFFIKYHGVTPPTDYESFVKFLNKKQEAFADHLRDLGADILEFTEPPHMLHFFWIEDDEDAVFTFQNLGPKIMGVAFRTRDARLIGIFARLFQKSWDDNLLLALKHKYPRESEEKLREQVDKAALNQALTRQMLKEIKGDLPQFEFGSQPIRKPAA